MKNQTKLCLALVLALPLAACGEKKAADSMKDAASAATSKIEDIKASFAKMTEGQMGDISKSISDLQSKAASLTGEKKAELDGLIKNIAAKKGDLVKMFDDAKGLTGDGFEKMKEKLATGIDEIKKMIDSAMAKLK